MSSTSDTRSRPRFPPFFSSPALPSPSRNVILGNDAPEGGTEAFPGTRGKLLLSHRSSNKSALDMTQLGRELVTEYPNGCQDSGIVTLGYRYCMRRGSGGVDIRRCQATLFQRSGTGRACLAQFDSASQLCVFTDRVQCQANTRMQFRNLLILFFSSFTSRCRPPQVIQLYHSASDCSTLYLPTLFGIPAP
jgi:hypothetical protein